MNIIFSEHATFEINMRKIKKEDIENLVKNAPQKLGGKKNRIIIQGKYPDKDQNKEMLLRYYLIAMRIRTADKRRRAELSSYSPAGENPA